jgi:hypothetical protein
MSKESIISRCASSLLSQSLPAWVRELLEAEDGQTGENGAGRGHLTRLILFQALTRSMDFLSNGVPKRRDLMSTRRHSPLMTTVYESN